MNINKHVQMLEYPEYADSFKTKKVRLNLAQHKGRDEECNYTLSQDKSLLRSIARIENLKKENILITAGADAALHHIAEVFLDDGKIAVIPTPSFGRFEFHVKVVGGKIVFVGHQTFPYSFDLDKITKVAKANQAEIILLANPNNPTGELIDKKRLERFIIENKQRLIAIDEVLVEDRKDSLGEFVNSYKNLVVVKSFSKLFGVPGLRVGYILANPQLVRLLSKTVSPYEISSLSLLTVKRILSDRKYIGKVKRELKKARNLLKEHLSFPLTNTSASLGLISGSGKTSLFDYLSKHGILTVEGRSFRGLENSNSIRIVINNVSDIKKLIRIIKKYNK